MRAYLFAVIAALTMMPAASNAGDAREILRKFVEQSGKQVLTCKGQISQSCNASGCSHTALNPGASSLTIDLVKAEVTSCWFEECHTDRFLEVFDHAGLVIGFRQPEMFFNNITLFDVWVKLRPYENEVVSAGFGMSSKSTFTTHYNCEVQP